MRIPLVEPDDPSTDPSTAAVLSGVFEAWGTEFNILKAVANNKQVLEAYVTFIGGVYGGLPDDVRELAYLTTAITNEDFY
jgi:hypothetical protein